MTRNEAVEASEKIRKIQEELYFIEKLFSKDDLERQTLLAVRMNLGRVDAMLQSKL